MDHIVVDVEIQKCIGEGCLTWDDTDKLGVACACVWQYADQRMRVYGPNDVKALQDRLVVADRISGFNIFRFDIPVIWGINKWDWNNIKHPTLFSILSHKTDDLLRRIWQALDLNPDEFGPSHKGWYLDAIASSTLGVGKIGNGAEAPKWFQAGEWARVANYCSDDVAIERDLCDFIDRYGYVLNQRVMKQPLVIRPWSGQV